MKLAEIKKNHDFLSLLIAASALLLSQFPPIYTIFYSPELEIRRTPELALSPSIMGGISISKMFSVTNTGQEPGRVRNVFLFIADSDGKEVYRGVGKSYRLNTMEPFGQPKWERFTELSLQPGDNWSHSISFSKPFYQFEIDPYGWLRSDIESERSEYKLEMEEAGYDLDKFNENMPQFLLSEELTNRIAQEIRDQVPWFEEGSFRLIEAVDTQDEIKFLTYDFDIGHRSVEFFLNSIESFKNIDFPSVPMAPFRLEAVDGRIPAWVHQAISRHKGILLGSEK